MNCLVELCLLLKTKVQYIRLRHRISRWVEKGLQIGQNVTIMPTVTIDHEYPYLIKIGNNCSLSNHVTILAHDATTYKFTEGYTRIEPVTLFDNVFVGENAIILPGVTVGPNVLIAAGSVVNKSLPPNSCNAGVPARRYCAFDDFIRRNFHQIESSGVVHYPDLHGQDHEEVRLRLKELVRQKGRAYVRGNIGGIPYTFNGTDFR